jgi:hypothetical protein
MVATEKVFRLSFFGKLLEASAGHMTSTPLAENSYELLQGSEWRYAKK